jgi:cytochrome P450
MNDYIGKELDKRYNEYKADAANTRSKAVIDIVLQAYMPEDAKTAPANLDPDFRAFAIRQIRLFVFAGHDSTSSTICYILHLLATNPEPLIQLRAEHDAVFGKNLAATQSLLESHPHLTENLPYTTAIIKETLRLFTPAGSSKAGRPRVNLTDDAGNHCPTDEATIFFVHVEMHRSPKYWIRPDDFLPERWLVDPGHELYPMKGAVSVLIRLLFKAPSKLQ